MDDRFDVIVVGLGGHGSSTLAHLARHHPNLRVLGIEQFSVTHKNGSSHGRSRIYRQAYFEDPAYVPLLQRSLELWKELHAFHEQRYPTASFRPLDLCGGVMIGPPDSEVVQGTLASIAHHSLPHQILSATEMKERYGVFHLSDHEIGIWESNAGYLHPEVCIETFIALAEQHAANIHYNERLLSYESIDPTLAESQGMSLVVVTDLRRYYCRKLILTVGAWANEIYGHALPTSFPLTIERRVLFWFEPIEPDNADLHNQFKRMPVYIWDLGQAADSGNFYGFPEQSGYEGIKVAMHHRKDEKLIVTSPSCIDRVVTEEEVQLMRDMLREKIPAMNGRLLHTETCMYTMTSDQHFLIDFHPSLSDVILASPCSGHGFKFVSVIGEILGELAVSGDTRHDIRLFRLNSDMRR